MMPIQYIDSPNVSIGTVITYKVKIYGGAPTICINKTILDSDTISYERMTSNVRLTEFAGTPSDYSMYTGNNTAKMGYFHARDEKPSGTISGTFTLAIWQTRDLNALVNNGITNASLSDEGFNLTKLASLAVHLPFLCLPSGSLSTIPSYPLAKQSS